ncbi:MAG: methionine--tRNA ligase subunit beta, partial [Planctomycetes bacterium]|nr:methionine--tRNA ligase subunit beta [Planctomycetota bacterium]
SQRVSENQKIGTYTLLAKRMEATAIDAMVAATMASVAPAPEPAKKECEPLADEISIEDFARVDLRVARILEASDVPEASKLLRLRVDLGFCERTIFAGIKQAYKPESLVGRLVVIVANLKARKMKFGNSEGMALAAGPGGAELFLLAADCGAEPGMRVR